MIKRLSKNFFFLILGEGLSHLIGFVVNAYIARILGVKGFGIINYSLAFLTYLLLFSTMGLPTLGAREVARDHNNMRIIGEIIGTRFFLTLFLYIIFLLSLLIIPGNPVIKKIIFLYILTSIPYVFYLEFVFQAREEMEYVAGAKIIQYLSYFILILIFLKSKNQIFSVPISFLGSYIIATLFLLIFFIQKYKKIYLSFDPLKSYQRLLTALPIGFATIIYQALINLPVICLGVFHSEKEVGLFSAGFKIILLLLIVERAFYYLLFPIFSKQDQKKIGKSLAFFSQLILSITFLITIIGLIFAKNIITMIYGADFTPGSEILRILLLYFMIAPLNTIWGYGLIALNQEKKFFNVILLIAISNLILISILGYLLKGIGVAMALFISELFGLLIMKRNLNSVVYFNLFSSSEFKDFKDLLKE
uniref:Flippase n=1 Tax=candidate division WOR-3 bacterium TaxID=2052148 RepID=A0A7C6EKM2_UNCW3